MRIEHSRLIDIVLFAGKSCINSNLMYANLPQIKCSQLMRKGTDVARLDTAFIGKASYFYAAIGRKVVNQVSVHYVSAK